MRRWSYSGLKSFESCPRKYHEEYVERRYPREESEQASKGTRGHTAAENYVRDGTPLPDEFKGYQSKLDAIMCASGTRHCELKMALDQDRKPVAFDAPTVWVRGIADLVITGTYAARVVDYKTGSAKYPDKNQLELMALMCFEHFPETEEVLGGLLFLSHDVFVKGRYLRSEADARWEGWNRRSKIMENAYESDVWPPVPNGLCREWCPVKHCEFNGYGR